MRNFDTHKKKVLSDEVGCGMALELSSVIDPTLRFIDTEHAIALQLLKTDHPRSRRPDYFAADPLNPGAGYAIEAKGSQQGDSYATKTQIPAGCDQVSHVQLQTPSPVKSLLRIVFATAISFESWKVPWRTFVGDPAEVEPVPYHFARSLSQTAGIMHYLRIARLIGDHRLEGSLLSMADEGLGSRSFGDEALDARSDERRPIGPDWYVGTTIELAGKPGRVLFFFGLLEAVRTALLRGDLEEAARVARKPHPPDSPQPAPEQFSAKTDGTLLSVEIDRQQKTSASTVE